MTIDEAIKHCEEVAERQDYLSKQDHGYCEEKWNVQKRAECAECAADHRQLAEWLTELKQWRRVYGVCPSYEMCIPECREGYDAQIVEYKMLLRDIKAYYKSDSNCKEHKCADCVHFDECGWGKQHPDGYKWRFEDAVNALIGGSDESKN